MKWEARWKILADAIMDLRKSGEAVPFSIINDLRSAKIMLEILKVDKSRSENISRLEEYLSNVEAYVLPIAKNRFGEPYVNDMLRKIYRSEVEETGVEEAKMRFHPNLPREKKWIRIQITGEMSLEMIKKIARERGLEYRIERDGYVLVYGENEAIKRFVKKMAETLRGVKKN